MSPTTTWGMIWWVEHANSAPSQAITASAHRLYWSISLAGSQGELRRTNHRLEPMCTTAMLAYLNPAMWVAGMVGRN